MVKQIIMAANGREGELIARLNTYGMKYKALQGSYKGQTELSFQIDVRSPFDSALLKHWARAYSQESILLIDADKTATLYFVESRATLSIGRYLPASREIALQYDAYSLDLSTGEYYLAA